MFSLMSTQANALLVPLLTLISKGYEYILLECACGNTSPESQPCMRMPVASVGTWGFVASS
jgi:hypothetical protein